MKKLARRMHIAAMNRLRVRRAGMELVQVAILVALAIMIGIVFKKQISQFVTDVFSGLQKSSFGE